MSHSEIIAVFERPRNRTPLTLGFKASQTSAWQLNRFPKCMVCQEAALLATSRESRAEKTEHVEGAKCEHRINRFLFAVLHQHGSGRLADDAAGARKPSLFDDPASVDKQLNSHAVTAKWIVDAVPMSRQRKRPTVIRLLKMRQHVILIHSLFLFGRHVIYGRHITEIFCAASYKELTIKSASG